MAFTSDAKRELLVSNFLKCQSLDKQVPALFAKNEEQMETISKRNANQDDEIKRLRDLRSVVKQEKEDLRIRLTESKREEEQEDRRLKEAKTRKEAAQKQLDNIEKEVEDINSDIPRLNRLQQLYYSCTKATLDNRAKENEVKGFIVDSNKKDFKVFDFNMADTAISQQFISNYLWDSVADIGTEKWSKFT